MNHGGIPPFRETRDYVTRILGLFTPPAAPAANAAPSVSVPRNTYRTIAPDGTITYTNIPSPQRL